MIASRDDIELLAYCEDDPTVVRLRVRGAAGIASRRDMVVVSSCGACGARGLDELLEQLPVCGDTFRVTAPGLNHVVEVMRDRQTLFSQTGGTHAAAIFDSSGEILSFGEDIGRHNALDKAVGRCVLSGTLPTSCGVALSGRVSFELVAKAARAGIELMAAVSAPTSLAVTAAERARITLAAFVRGERATVYALPHRVRG
jgi:FdhD protein